MPFKRLHPWCGRIYILSMLWSTATSLLIHNTGLPGTFPWNPLTASVCSSEAYCQYRFPPLPPNFHDSSPSLADAQLPTGLTTSYETHSCLFPLLTLAAAAVLLSFLWVLIGLTLAWIIIVFHTYYLDREAAARVEIK